MSGSGTSFNQPYHTNGGILSLPHETGLGGNTALFENGSGSISTNYAPTLHSTGGGRSRRRGTSKRSKKRFMIINRYKISRRRRRTTHPTKRVRKRRICSICNLKWD